MKVNRWKIHGKLTWVVDGVVEGKRRRETFDSKAQAEAFVREHHRGQRTHSDWWLSLDSSDRVDLINAHAQAKAAGFKLLQAVEHFKGTDRSLVPMTIGEAVALGLRERERGGKRHKSILNLRTVWHRFRDWVGENTPVASIDWRQIDQWLAENRWSGQTLKNYQTILHTLFEDTVKKRARESNPVAALSSPSVETKRPPVLSVAQAGQLLSVTEAHDSGMLTYVALALFAGIRPAEIGRLGADAIRENHVEVLHGKTRKRRIVDLEPVAKFWLAKGEPLALRNLRKRFDRIKAQLDFEWQQDVMRHSFCSYHLAAFENAARTALQAGHTEKVLFDNYRELVFKCNAVKFWQTTTYCACE